MTEWGRDPQRAELANVRVRLPGVAEPSQAIQVVWEYPSGGDRTKGTLVFDPPISNGSGSLTPSIRVRSSSSVVPLSFIYYCTGGCIESGYTLQLDASSLQAQFLLDGKMPAIRLTCKVFQDGVSTARKGPVSILLPDEATGPANNFLKVVQSASNETPSRSITSPDSRALNSYSGKTYATARTAMRNTSTAPNNRGYLLSGLPPSYVSRFPSRAPRSHSARPSRGNHFTSWMKPLSQKRPHAHAPDALASSSFSSPLGDRASFRNTGNSCYFSAVLSVLVHLRPFCDALLCPLVRDEVANARTRAETLVRPAGSTGSTGSTGSQSPRQAPRSLAEWDAAVQASPHDGALRWVQPGVALAHGHKPALHADAVELFRSLQRLVLRHHRSLACGGLAGRPRVPLSPRSIQKALGKRDPRFESYLQQDAHELWVTIMEQVEDELQPVGPEIADALEHVAFAESQLEHPQCDPGWSLDAVLPKSLRVWGPFESASRSLHAKEQRQETETSGRAKAEQATTGQTKMEDDTSKGVRAGDAPESTPGPQHDASWRNRRVLPSVRCFHWETRLHLGCLQCEYTRSHVESFHDISLDLGLGTAPVTEEPTAKRARTMSPDGSDSPGDFRSFVTGEYISAPRTPSPPPSAEAPAVSLETLLRGFFRTSEQELRCEECGHDRVEIRPECVSLPNVLVIHLKRFRPLDDFGSRWEKLHQPVMVPETISLRQFCNDGVRQPPPVHLHPSGLSLVEAQRAVSPLESPSEEVEEEGKRVNAGDGIFQETPRPARLSPSLPVVDSLARPKSFAANRSPLRLAGTRPRQTPASAFVTSRRQKALLWTAARAQKGRTVSGERKRSKPWGSGMAAEPPEARSACGVAGWDCHTSRRSSSAASPAAASPALGRERSFDFDLPTTPVPRKLFSPSSKEGNATEQPARSYRKEQQDWARDSGIDAGDEDAQIAWAMQQSLAEADSLQPESNVAVVEEKPEEKHDGGTSMADQRTNAEPKTEDPSHSGENAVVDLTAGDSRDGPLRVAAAEKGGGTKQEKGNPEEEEEEETKGGEKEESEEDELGALRHGLTGACDAEVPCDATDRAEFSLHAVVRHWGTGADFGHYVTDVKDDSAAKPTWYRHNDADVRRIDKSSVFHESGETDAYMLIYVRKQPEERRALDDGVIHLDSDG